MGVGGGRHETTEPCCSTMPACHELSSMLHAAAASAPTFLLQSRSVSRSTDTPSSADTCDGGGGGSSRVRTRPVSSPPTHAVNFLVGLRRVEVSRALVLLGHMQTASESDSMMMAHPPARAWRRPARPRYPMPPPWPPPARSPGATRRPGPAKGRADPTPGPHRKTAIHPCVTDRGTVVEQEEGGRSVPRQEVPS